MADAADDSVDIQERALQETLRNRVHATRPRATGHCLNPVCQEDLDVEGALFCNSNCANEYEKYRK